MSKKKPNIKSIDGLPAVGALIGVGVGVYSRLGVFITLLLGSAFAGMGYYINNKFNQ
jgi:hypothetical protein